MKMNYLKAAAAFGLSALLASTAAAQNNAASKPVGYETVDLAPSQFNLVGARLVNAVIQTGTLTGASGDVLSDTNADFSALTGGPYVVEITDGNGSGFVSVIDSISGTDLTTVDTITAGAGAAQVGAGSVYAIREATTVQGLFGDPATDLVSAGAEASSDVVWVFDSETSGYTRYFFQQPFIGNPRWFNASDNSAVTGPIVIPPTGGFFVEKRDQQASVVITGSVRTDATTFLQLNQGFNPVSGVYPAGSTLQNSGLQDVLASAGNEAGSDVVYLPDGAGYTRYFFQQPFIGDARWFNASANAVAQDNIELPTAFFIEKKDAGVEFIPLTAPSFYSNL